jgi:hypothetical protein|tara:strand:- start:189 stop:386 length:198 start_codon:yes stop_codon:yes gene_type:complete
MNNKMNNFKEWNSETTDVTTDAKWILMTMDVLAEDNHGEFGFDTCNEDTKIEIIARMLEDKLIKV